MRGRPPGHLMLAIQAILAENPTARVSELARLIYNTDRASDSQCDCVRDSLRRLARRAEKEAAPGPPPAPPTPLRRLMRPGKIQQAILEILDRNPSLAGDAHTLARVVYNIGADDEPNTSQRQCVRQALRSLERRAVTPPTLPPPPKTKNIKTRIAELLAADPGMTPETIAGRIHGDGRFNERQLVYVYTVRNALRAAQADQPPTLEQV